MFGSVSARFAYGVSDVFAQQKVKRRNISVPICLKRTLVVLLAVIETALLTSRSLSGNPGNDDLPETGSLDNGGVYDRNEL